MGTLYIVATPIGNLEDITERALRVLREADLVVCEDTRVTHKLLDHYNIKTSTISYHQHSNRSKTNTLISLLRENKTLALVTDAGTPGISDPGNKLIEDILSEIPDVSVVPVPGPSALAAAASISGFPTDSFIFLGYPPAKKKRKKFFQEAISAPYTVIFYESPHRVLKSLRELEALLGKRAGDVRAVVAKELTKMFETTYRGDITHIIEGIERDGARGEYVIVLHQKKKHD